MKKILASGVVVESSTVVPAATAPAAGAAVGVVATDNVSRVCVATSGRLKNTFAPFGSSDSYT